MLTKVQKTHLLDNLADDYDMELSEMLDHAIIDSVVPGICYKCGYTIEVEPDQRGGWCESCDTGTVVSCLVLADII